MSQEVKTWLEFWNGPNSIYVNSRHRVLHGRLIAHDIAGLIPCSNASILDFACGEASAADDVAYQCRKLVLSDAAERVRATLTKKYSGHPNITVITNDEVGRLPHGSFDLIIVNSLLQYISKPELDQLLAMLRPLIRGSGVLVLGDLIPPNQTAIGDASALLRLSYQGKFLISAMLGLVKIYFSPYRRLRSTIGLSRYTESEILGILGKAGFVGERRRSNIGHNQGRMTFVARKR
jgi:2-polyprenyl-3-methyl-5-hydroxy-6-metoxy-1,4-benzoquinol methylase